MNRLLFSTVNALLAIGLLITIVGRANADISGTVHLQGRTDHSGVSIEVYDVTGGAVFSTTTTLASGDFYSPGTAMGSEYRVTATMSGYINLDNSYNLIVRTLPLSVAQLTTRTLLAGDTNSDMVINILDLVFLANRFGCSTACGNEDLNDDGVVNIQDLALLSGNFSATATPYWPWTEVVLTRPRLLMYYDFNSETSGSVTDLSGNGQTGALNGTTLTADGEGYTGSDGDKALSYSGTDFFTATSTALGQPYAGDLAISFWYKTSTATSSWPLADHSQFPDNTEGYQLYTTNDANAGNFSIWDDSDNLISVSGSLTTLADSLWHHVVVNVDRSGNITVYVDGVVSGTPESAAPLTDLITLSRLDLGTFNAGQIEAAVEGQIDDYAIFNHLLTPSQIAGLLDGGLTPITALEFIFSSSFEELP